MLLRSPDHCGPIIGEWYKKQLDQIDRYSEHYPDIRKQQKVQKVYNTLNSILAYPCVEANPKISETIQNETRFWLEKQGVEFIFEHLESLGNIAEPLLEHFSQHFEHIWKNSKTKITYEKAIEKLAGKSKILHIDSRPVCRVLSIILNEIDIPQSDSVEAFKQVMSSYHAWMKVFQSSGIYSDQIRYHSTSQHVKDIICQFYADFEAGTMYITAAVEVMCCINKERDSAMRFLAVVTGSNSHTTFNKRSMCLAETQESLKILIEFEHHYIKRLEEHFHFTDSDIVRTKLNTVETIINEGKSSLQELEDSDKLWDTLTKLINPGKKLIQFKDSNIFFKVCIQELESYKQSRVKEPNSEPELDTEAFVDCCSTDSCPLTVMEMSEVLCCSAMKTFKDNSSILFDRSDIPLETVRNFFQKSDIQQEIKFLECNFSKKTDSKIREALEEFDNYPTTKERAENMKGTLVIFDITSEDDIYLSAIHAVELCQTNPEGTLFQMYDAAKKFKSISITDEMWAVINELSHAVTLVIFIRDNIQEDFRNLIDAVEEHSEQLISESTVSSLIDVKMFVKTITVRESLENAKSFFSFLEQAIEFDTKQQMPVKIRECSECVNSLKALYNNVANRGERTKEIINSLLIAGKIKFYLLEGLCTVSIYYGYEGTEKVSTFSLSGLSDYRSRALLIVNTDKVSSSETAESETERKKLKVDLSNFIQGVDNIQEIVAVCTLLHSSGNFKFRTYEKIVACFNDLHCLKEELTQENKKWTRALQNARKQFHYLNFLYADQLCTVYDCIKATDICDTSEAMDVLKFIDPSITVTDFLESVPLKTVDESLTYDDFLCVLGELLESIFKTRKPSMRKFVNGTIHRKTVEAKVKSGGFFVAELKPNSTHVLHTVMKLFTTTTGCLPEPSNLIFCSLSSTWDEIDLFLKRCISMTNSELEPKLYCLANVELLSNKLQFQLVEGIKHILDGQSKFLLCAICRGSSSHPVIDHFSKYVHRIESMTNEEMRICLSKMWPNVVTITSEVPGLGKSEAIQISAFEKHLDVVRVLVSGEIKRKKYIKRLRDRHLHNVCILHIDITEIDDPFDVEIFIFELIVLNIIRVGTTMFHLDTNNISIELGNSLQDRLRNALLFTTCFQRVHLRWNDYNDMIVSQEVLSPVQVVCYYLYYLDSEKIDTEDVNLFQNPPLTPLTADSCRSLLRKYFPSRENENLSFSIANVFLNVLADQLRKLSSSSFFKSATLTLMLGEKERNTVRSSLVRELIAVYKDFASRSVKSCRDTQKEAMNAKVSDCGISATVMENRVTGMIHWTDVNHLLVVFHAQANSVSPLYRNLHDVSSSISKLFESQMPGERSKLPEYDSLTAEELQMELEKIVRLSKQPLAEDVLPKFYALTPDNLLKMTLIFLRIKAGIPVIIMGETGCGKTTLIKYLATTCEITKENLDVFNFHAGIEEDDVLTRISKANTTALGNLQAPYWLFLDEINTCNHLGLLNEIICHKSMHGECLAPNLVLLAACNPYRLRGKNQILTAGLQEKAEIDEKSELVYRVNPLPESMIDYLWDFGSLNEEDEKKYIVQMIKANILPHQHALAELLTKSQNFIRSYEKSSSSVSLRDVNRCKKIIEWFINYLKEKARASKHYRYQGELEIRAIILGLAHCYLCRLSTAKDRNTYQEMTTKIMKKFDLPIDDDSFENIVREEQEDILNRMELPSGTAKNTALRENVFVILVCLLNKIPIFVVGKPGCSKSLSVQLIRSNLRGADSKDELFKKMPQLYVVSFQGSEYSTSDGIQKVFEKAISYSAHTKDGSVLPVVLLDEIGLAEQSRFNPLKVLHSLLEPAGQEFPDVAVVGISNWALDAAKMNRAIHLSRPDPDETELYETGLSISLVNDAENDWSVTGENEYKISKSHLRALAQAYYSYQKQQAHKHFHGLRDFYSLIKYLCGLNDFGNVLSSDQVITGLLRNFGGTPSNTQIIDVFKNHLGGHYTFKKTVSLVSVKKLVKDNIEDKQARHLMLITNGDSAIGLLGNIIGDFTTEREVMFGSKFDEDMKSKDYSYRILSRIILCMERGVILILKDLENIYGSLYDMLNQNYTICGKTRNCRIALGAYSNPMCHVHENFRCVVLVDESKVDFSDPPFLNRFEKQQLMFKDVISVEQHEYIKEIEREIMDISEIENKANLFDPEDTFLGYSDDSLSSLIIKMTESHPTDTSNLKEDCFQELLWTATPDGILRASRSIMYKHKQDHLCKIQKMFFDLPLHKGLHYFLLHVMNKCEEKHGRALWFDDGFGFKIIVQTRSNILSILTLQSSDMPCQVDKLGAYKSEKQLTDKLESFWKSESSLLILQCKPSEDAEHMLLAKSIIERQREAHKVENACKPFRKNVLIIIHYERKFQSAYFQWRFNFLDKWRLVTIDALDVDTSVTELVGKDVFQVITEGVLQPVEDIVRTNILKCFALIRYSQSSRPYEETIDMISDIVDSACAIPEFLASKILNWLQTNNIEAIPHDAFHPESWQVVVACDCQALSNSSTLLLAMRTYIQSKVIHLLESLVYQLESLSVWQSFFNDEYKDFWKQCLENKKLFDFYHLPDVHGLNTCDEPPLPLRFPFSRKFTKILFDNKDFLMDSLHRLENNPENCTEDEEIKPEILTDYLNSFVSIIQDKLSELAAFANTDERVSDFLFDFCLLVSQNYAGVLSSVECHIAVCKTINSKMSAATLEQGTNDNTLHVSTVQKPEKASHVLKIANFVMTYWRHTNLIQSVLRLLIACKGASGLDIQYEILEPVSSSNSPFDQGLVQHICEAMIPTDAVLTKCGGIKEWQTKSNVVLAVAGRVSLDSPDLHFLRVCKDFAANVITPHELSCEYLTEIAHLKQEGFNLDNKETFDLIYGMMYDLLTSNCIETAVAQNFLCVFIDRCYLINCEDCLAWNMMLEKMAKHDLIDNNLSFFSPILQTFLTFECGEDEASTTFLFCQKAMQDDGLINDNRNLARVTECLTTCENSRESPLAVLVCDIIHNIIKTYLKTVVKEDVLCSQEVKEILHIAAIAKQIVVFEENVSLKVVIAVAYLKAVVETFASHISSGKLTHEQAKFDIIFQQLECLWSSSSEAGSENDIKICRSTSIAYHMLKMLHSERSLQDTIHLSKKMPSLVKINLGVSQELGVLDYPILYKAEHFQEMHKAFRSFCENPDEKNCKKILEISKISQDHKFSLLSVLTDFVYLRKSHRPHNDSETQMYKQLSDELQEQKCLSAEFLYVVNCLLGVNDFINPVFNINSESSYRDVQYASFVLHLICLSSSYCDTECSEPHPLLLKAVHYPITLNDIFVPSCQGVLEQKAANSKEHTASSCSCQHIIMGDIQICPMCFNKLKHPIEYQSPLDDYGHDVPAAEPSKGYIWIESDDSKYIHQDRVSPVTQAFSSLLIQGLLNASITLTGCDSAGKVTEEAADVYKKRFIFMWKLFEDLVGISPHKTCFFINFVTSQMKHLLVEPWPFDSLKQTRLWENSCEETMKPLFINRHLRIQEALKQTWEVKKPSETISALHEVIDVNKEYRKLYLPSLFRTVHQNTLRSLESDYMNLFGAEINPPRRYPFIHLFYKKRDRFPILSYLLPLVKWQKLVANTKNHRMSRPEAKQSVSALTDSEKSSKMKRILCEAYDEFAKSWNQLRSHQGSNVLYEIDPSIKKLPQMRSNNETLIEDCVANNAHCLVYKVIACLASIQNDFIEMTLRLVLKDDASAVNFLYHEGAAVFPEIPIENISEAHVMKWDPDWGTYLLKFSQRNQEVGMGYEIQYDFGVIESELANRMLIGKAFLRFADTFPFLMFAKEMFHTSGRILLEIQREIPQEKISSEAAETLKSMHERTSSMNNLLISLDMVLLLLLKTGGDPKEFLKQYVKKYVTALKQPFPIELLPGDSLMLCHVVALYEQLEEILFTDAENNLPDEYSIEQQSTVKAELEKKLKTYDCFFLKSMLTSLRRFIFRYISSSEGKMPDTSLSLSQKLLETNLLSRDGMDLFHEDILLSHLYVTVKTTQDILKEKDEEENRKLGKLAYSQPKLTTRKRKLNRHARLT